MRILITGASGFIGCELVRFLINKNHDVFCTVNKEKESLVTITNIGSDKLFFLNKDNLLDMDLFIKKNNFDGIIHLATYYVFEHSEKDLNPMLSCNITFGVYLIELAVKNKVKWFINVGTFFQHFHSEIYRPVNLYAATKQAFFDVLDFYNDKFEIKIIDLKLNDTIGVSDKRKKIPLILKESMKNNSSIDMSPGEQLINILDIEDVLAGFYCMLKYVEHSEKKQEIEKFVLRSSETITLKKLVELFEKISNKRLSVNWGGREYRAREIMIPWTGGHLVPGWSQKIKLIDSVKKFLENESGKLNEE